MMIPSHRLQTRATTISTMTRIPPRLIPPIDPPPLPRIVFVPDLADHFLEDVLDRDDALELAVFVDDGADRRSLFLHSLQEHVERKCRWHDRDVVAERLHWTLVLAVEERFRQLT